MATQAGGGEQAEHSGGSFAAKDAYERQPITRGKITPAHPGQSAQACTSTTGLLDEHMGGNDLLMKMDIEGHEWEAIDALLDENLSNFPNVCGISLTIVDT